MPPKTLIAEGRFNRHQLYRLRVERNLNYRRASLLCNMSLAWYWKLEKGKTIKPVTVDMVNRLSTGFGVPNEYFFVPEHDSYSSK